MLEDHVKTILANANVQRELSHVFLNHTHFHRPQPYETQFMITSGKHGIYLGDTHLTEQHERAAQEFSLQEYTHPSILFWASIANSEYSTLTRQLTFAENDRLTLVSLKSDPNFSEHNYRKPSSITHHPHDKDFVMLNKLAASKPHPTILLMYAARDIHFTAIQQHAQHMTYEDLARNTGFYKNSKCYQTTRGYFDIARKELILDSDLLKPLSDE